MVKVDEVKIKMLSDLGATSVAVRASGRIGGQAIGLAEPTPATATIMGDYIVATDLESFDPIPDVVKHDEIVLHWQVSLDAGPWIDVGTSVNTAYVTWDDPTTAAPFETCLYLGCGAADGIGGADPAPVVAAAWGEFTDRHVERVDGATLGYYRGGAYDPNLPVYAPGLLEETNGQCSAWTDLFKQVLGAQGIASAEMSVQPVDAPLMLVKNWDFTGDGSSPATDPYLWVEGTDLTKLAGVAGQDEDNPPSVFARHFVVKWNNQYYDPSYGKGPYTSESDWESDSLAGFGKRFSGVLHGRKDGPAQETVFAEWGG